MSGQLNKEMGGPSVFPEIPDGMEVRGGWKKNESEEAKNRRSIYVFVRRNSRYPMFHVFDMPDTHESCGGVPTPSRHRKLFHSSMTRLYCARPRPLPVVY